MQTIAAELSSAQISALAHYYAGLPVQTTTSPPGDPALVQRGETIATVGVPESAVPACANCHESSGASITGAPHLAGQSVTYLRRELIAMRHGGRGSSAWWNPMPAVAHALSDKDILAAAAYYSGLKPARTASGAQPGQPPQGAPPPQAAGGDLAAAKDIFTSQCLKCHVHDGRGDLQGDYPDLTLQTTPFVAQALYEFHSGARPGDQMRQVTEGLSLDDMNNLAHYVNSLTPQPALAKPDAVAAQRGAAIATRGDPARGVPACLSCHDAKGVAALPLIPRLQGQNAFYLRKKLALFAEPYGMNLSALNPMPLIARKLTDQERSDLAAYFAAAAPLPKPPAQP
jgi:cytochrome c553